MRCGGCYVEISQYCWSMRSLSSYFILSLLLIVCRPVSAADDGLDSLWAVVTQAPPGVELRTALMDLATYYQMRNNDSVYYYADLLWQLGQTNNDPQALIESKLITGAYHHNQGRLAQGRKNYHEGAALAKEYGLPKLLGFAYLDLGLNHSRGFNLDSSYYYLQEAERIFIEEDIKESLWKCFNGTANLHDKRQDYDAAEENYRKAIETIPAEASKADRGFLLYSAFAFAILRQRFDLMHDVRLMWDEYKSSNSFDTELLQQPEHFSLFRMIAGEGLDLEEILFAAADYHRESGSVFKLASIYHDLGILYSDRQEYGKSRDAYEEADRLYTSIGYSSYIVFIRSRLAEFYAQDGNYKKAYAYSLSSHQLVDSLRNADAERNLKRFQVEYETQKKEQALRINQLELKQKTQERNIWLGSSVFLALLAISIFSAARQRIRQRELLTAQEKAIQDEKIQRLEQEKRLLALSAMIDGQEQERRRIAKDLHDGMGGLLTTIKAHYNTIGEAVMQDEKYREVVPQTGALIDRACTEVRRISQNMMPAALLYSGLEGALEDLAVQIRTNNIQCDLEVLGDLNELEESKAVSIYRIMQETVNNILKHADATRVLLQLIVHDNTLHITVEDDGKGFDFAEALKQKSVGMKSLSSRVQYLKGEWDVDSEAGEGTIITFNLPL